MTVERIRNPVSVVSCGRRPTTPTAQVWLFVRLDCFRAELVHQRVVKRLDRVANRGRRVRSKLARRLSDSLNPHGVPGLVGWDDAGIGKSGGERRIEGGRVVQEALRLRDLLTRRDEAGVVRDVDLGRV